MKFDAKFDVKVPAVGESITEATIGKWIKKSGDFVKLNDPLLVLETDKASVEIVAEQEGILTISIQENQTIPIGTIVAQIDTSATAPIIQSNNISLSSGKIESVDIHSDLKAHLSPAVQKIVSEKHIDPSTIQGTGRGGRLTKEDVLKEQIKPVGQTPVSQTNQVRKPMSSIRKKIAERLVHSQQTTATLTTFNEIDMSKVMELRAKYKDKFKEKYGVSLGFMGFFVKAAIEALKAWPAVNAFIEGSDIVYNNYYNIGVAVGTDKGLIVPVIKNAEKFSLAEVENAIKDFSQKARDGKITIEDLSGGTFTISNGGVYGSLLSTPILNPPQSGILGMHKIEERPVAINGKIEIRPLMYVALSYDHRIIDGKEAVSFLVKIKEGVEDPERLLLEI